MSVETRKVLEMLAAGKITSEDAERLLDKLAAVKEPAESGAPENRESSCATSPRRTGSVSWQPASNRHFLFISSRASRLPTVSKSPSFNPPRRWNE